MSAFRFIREGDAVLMYVDSADARPWASRRPPHEKKLFVKNLFLPVPESFHIDSYLFPISIFVPAAERHKGVATTLMERARKEMGQTRHWLVALTRNAHFLERHLRSTDYVEIDRSSSCTTLLRRAG